jgi:hypothetical protein
MVEGWRGRVRCEGSSASDQILAIIFRNPIFLTVSREVMVVSLAS